MRYLASVDTVIEGNQDIKWKLPAMPDSSQLVKILAYPTAKELYSISFDLKGYNNKSDTIWTNAELQAEVDGNFKTIRKFEIDRTKYQKLVGFTPYAPVELSLPGIRSSQFRLILEKPIQFHGNADAIIKLSSNQIVERYPEQSLAKMFQHPQPMWNSYMWPRLEWSHEKSGDVISAKDVKSLTSYLTADSVINWKVPEGHWTFSTFFMNPTGTTNNPATPDATGLEVDKMSKKTFGRAF